MCLCILKQGGVRREGLSEGRAAGGGEHLLLLTLTFSTATSIAGPVQFLGTGILPQDNTDLL